MASVKGSAMISRVKYLEEKAAPELKNKILAALSPELRELVTSTLLASTWYPFAYYVEFNRVLDKILGKGDLALILKIGEFSAEHALKGVYKLFYKVGSPEFVIKMGTKVWNQYFQNGSIICESIGPKAMHIILQDMEVYAQEHCLSVMGWVKRTLELSGGKNVQTRLSKPQENSAKRCEIIATWE